MRIARFTPPQALLLVHTGQVMLLVTEFKFQIVKEYLASFPHMLLSPDPHLTLIKRRCVIGLTNYITSSLDVY